jgi:hypothetical protein
LGRSGEKSLLEAVLIGTKEQYVLVTLVTLSLLEGKYGSSLKL